MSDDQEIFDFFDSLNENMFQDVDLQLDDKGYGQEENEGLFNDHKYTSAYKVTVDSFSIYVYEVIVLDTIPRKMLQFNSAFNLGSRVRFRLRFYKIEDLQYTNGSSLQTVRMLVGACSCAWSYYERLRRISSGDELEESSDETEDEPSD